VAGRWHDCTAWGRTGASRGGGRGVGVDGEEDSDGGAEAEQRPGPEAAGWLAVFFGGSGSGSGSRGRERGELEEQVRAGIPISLVLRSRPNVSPLGSTWEVATREAAQ
jgi:hypothetical protein